MENAKLVNPAVEINGTVTSFEAGKGYGFVAEGGGKELFAPAGDTYCHGSDLFSLGQRVRFQIFQGQLGPQAVGVRRY